MHWSTADTQKLVANAGTAAASVDTFLSGGKTGLDTLESLIEQMVFADTAHLSIDVCLDNGRQIECLIAAKRSISSALTAIADEMPIDCVAIDLRAAVSALGQITGETVSDEVVREIFAKFCLGK